MYLPGQERDSLVQHVCNGKLKSNTNDKYKLSSSDRQPSCHFLHHLDNYNRLGPFHIEVKYYYPMRILFHDFLYDEEMEWMYESSRSPLKSTMLWLTSNNITSFEQLSARGARFIAFNGTIYKVLPSHHIYDIQYHENDNYTVGTGTPPVIRNHPPNMSPVADPILHLKDKYWFLIKHTLLFRISKRIEYATKLNVTSRYGSHPYSIANCGLSSSLFQHKDSSQIGDVAGEYIATFMGWLTDTDVGGNTAFTAKSYEGTLEPRKGSAAFWVNLFSSQNTDDRSMHAGCPVLKGSKWLMNKWIYSCDQWKDWPCDLVENKTIGIYGGMPI